MSEFQKKIVNSGTQVGELARQLYPGGELCTIPGSFDFEAAAVKTATLIQAGAEVLYEAAFIAEDTLAVADILVKQKKGWLVLEVKSAASVKGQAVHDAALQYYVLKRAGLTILDFRIVYLNSAYELDGKLNIQELFIQESVLKKVKRNNIDIQLKIEDLKKIATEGIEPSAKIGPWCNSPYACDFKSHCWKNIPAPSVFDIAGLSTEKALELYDQGYVGVSEVPDHAGLNARQKQQVMCSKKNKVVVDKEQLKSFEDDLKFPLYFLDFETVMPPVPLFIHTHPFQQIVFQYSLHVLKNADAVPEHYSFLAEGKGLDPRPAFIESLLNHVGDRGDVLVYNISFEASCMRKLEKLFPQHSERIENMVLRMKDLMLPFKNRWYYHPDMNGSHSIKNVLPALAPELSYNDLQIGDGGLAGSVFLELLSDNFTGDESKARKDLQEYCERDTFGMVVLYKKIRDILS